MDVSTIGVPLSAVQHLTKFSGNDFRNGGTMIVGDTINGTVYIRPPNQNESTFVGNSCESSRQQISLSVPNSQQSIGDKFESNLDEREADRQIVASHKFGHHSTAVINWGESLGVNHTLSEKGPFAVNIPFTSELANGGATAVVALQPNGQAVVAAPAAGFWPVKLMQNASTMTEDSEFQAMAKIKEEQHTDMPDGTKEESCFHSQRQGKDESKGSDMHSEEEGGGGGDNNDDEGSDSEDGKSAVVCDVPTDCQQMHLQQQESAMADYLSRLPQMQQLAIPMPHFLSYPSNGGTSNSSGVITERKRGRLRPGDVRLVTTADGSTLYCCPDCSAMYADHTELELHMQGHRTDRRFVCSECGACLKRKEHLDQHMRGHSDERPFVCSVCLKGFKRNEHLTRHAVIHSGCKMHACNVCGKRFSRKDHLHKHSQTHVARHLRSPTDAVADSSVHPVGNVKYPTE